LFHALEEVFDDLEIDVGFEQRTPDVCERVRDTLFGELANSPQTLGRGSESFGDGLEQNGPPGLGP